jgi:hypothetical protein
LTRRSGSTPSSDRFGTKHALIVSLYRLVRVKKSTNRSESARSHAQVPQPFARPPHGLSMISNGPAGVRRRQNCIREYYGQEAPWLLRAAYRIACQRDIADDVIQDAFIQVWHEAHSFDPYRRSVGLDLQRCCNRALKRVLAHIYSDDCNCVNRGGARHSGAPSLNKPRTL